MLDFKRKRSILVKLAQGASNVEFTRGSTIRGGKAAPLPPKAQSMMATITNAANKVKSTKTSTGPQQQYTREGLIDPYASTPTGKRQKVTSEGLIDPYRKVTVPRQGVGKSLAGGPIRTRGGSYYNKSQGNMVAERKETAVPPMKRSEKAFTFNPRDVGPASSKDLGVPAQGRGTGTGKIPTRWGFGFQKRPSAPPSKPKKSEMAATSSSPRKGLPWSRYGYKPSKPLAGN